MRSLVKALAIGLAFVALVMLGYFGRDYVKLLGPPEKCWEIKEVEGRLYKVNPCTGQFVLIGDAPR
jgi:hypothetical protein